MHARLKTAAALAAFALATSAMAQVTLYSEPDFQGRTMTTERSVGDFRRSGFNDRASSATVLGGPWEACEDAEFSGRCRVLRQGHYPSLQAMGLNDRISSLRPLARSARVSDDRSAPPPEPAYDNRRRRNERLYQAEVTAVHAVVGTPGQRCRVERHQVAGAAVGSHIGRDDSSSVQTREVQRCNGNAAASRPGHWDVSYRFRGQDHRVQMTAAPGRTISVNRRGEPRV
jgi:Beta/Gamma crystallin